MLLTGLVIFLLVGARVAATGCTPTTGSLRFKLKFERRALLSPTAAARIRAPSAPSAFPVRVFLTSPALVECQCAQHGGLSQWRCVAEIQPTALHADAPLCVGYVFSRTRIFVQTCDLFCRTNPWAATGTAKASAPRRMKGGEQVEATRRRTLLQCVPLLESSPRLKTRQRSWHLVQRHTKTTPCQP